MQDAFLSYSRRDTAAANQLRTRLVAAGIETFTDRTALTPGRPWQPELQRALQECRAVIVLIGREGFGNLQQREVQLALALQSQDDTRLVIPVLLDGAESPSRFLDLNTWIDLGDPATDDVEYARLVGALRGDAAPGATEPPRVAICPYRALEAFREEDARFFFGRDDAIEELQQKVEQNPVVAVVGASGSGKSSVVRAGLAARLRQSEGEHTWQIVTLTPTDRPLRALAAAFLPLLDHGTGGDVAEMAATQTLEQALLTDAGALRDLVERALTNDPGTTRLLLIADQWEELYTLCEDQQLRDHFIAQLLDAARSDAFRCVLTVRGDFWGRVLESAPLTEQLRDAQVNLAPMGVDGLRQAIVEPAKAVGLGFEAGLVDRILADVGDEPGNLPLLEFLLFQLWELDHDDGTLSHEPYVQLGGVQGAIAHRAKEILADKSDAEKAQLRRVFGRLVRPGEGAADTRRRAALGEFASDDAKLIGDLVNARLLVKSTDEATGDGDGPVTLEVAHEALIRGWPELRKWADEDREFLSWLQRLHGAKAEHERTQVGSDLLTGHRLVEAVHWLEARGGDLADDERVFVQASDAKERGRRRLRVAIVAAVMAVLVAAFGVSLWFYQQSETARNESEQARKHEQRKTDPLLVDRLMQNAKPTWPSELTLEANLQWIPDWIKDADAVIGRKSQNAEFAEAHPTTTEGIELKRMLDRMGELSELHEDVASRPAMLEELWPLWERSAVSPQKGLLPLGMNEQRKWEFWMPISGSKPEWSDGGVKPTPDMALVFVLLEGGVFKFGEGTQAKEVTIEQSFFLSKYEVTNAQWVRLGGKLNGVKELTSEIKLRPVATASWNECTEWANLAGLILPSEEQWEYGCRAGTTTTYCFGDDEKLLKYYAWFSGNTERRLPDVGGLTPNNWGLHDLHGNLWEWCSTLYRGGGPRVFRGGSWNRPAEHCRSAYRGGGNPGKREDDLGFRPARSLLK